MRTFALLAAALAVLVVPAPAGSAAGCPDASGHATDEGDLLQGGARDDSYDGGRGNDEIRGAAGDDCLAGGDGSDYLAGDRGNDRLFGGPGDDQLEGGFGRDVLDGGSGDDLIGGGQERSVIHGGPGADRISSSNGVADDVDCGSGRDRVVADRSDRVRGCERVHYTTSPYPQVTPRSGASGTTFTVYFRALYAAGPGAPRQARYVIGLVHSGDCTTGYSSLGRTARARIAPGDIVRFSLPPGPHGGWCRGLFRGVAHFQNDHRDVRLGRFFFRVR
jgi:hypothetical protein